MARQVFNPTFKSGNITAPDLGRAASLINAPGQFLQDYLDKQQKAEQLAIENARADELLGFKRATEASRLAKEEQDRLLGEALAEQMSDRSVTETVKTPDKILNQKAIDLAKKSNAAIEEANKKRLDAQALASTDYSKIYESLMSGDSNDITKATATPVKEWAPGTNYKRIVNPDGTEDTAYIGGFLGDAFSSLKGVLDRTDKKKTYTPEEAHKIAMEKSGLGMVKAADLETSAVPEAQIQRGGTKQVTRSKSKQEWTKNAYDNLLGRKDLTGSTKLQALKQIKSQADTMYGKDAKGMSVAQQIKLMEMSSKNKTKKEETDDLRALIKSEMGDSYKVKASTNTGLKEEYKNILKRKEKGSNNKFGFDKSLKALEDMYKVYGDPDTIGTDDRAAIEADVADIQSKYKLTDSQMTSIINKSRGEYDGIIGVDESGFVDAVEDEAKKLKKR